MNCHEIHQRTPGCSEYNHRDMEKIRFHQNWVYCVISKDSPPVENVSRVLNEIHVILNSTLFFDVHLIGLKTSRVAHPVPDILGETLHQCSSVRYITHQVLSLWHCESILYQFCGFVKAGNFGKLSRIRKIWQILNLTVWYSIVIHIHLCKKYWSGGCRYWLPNCHNLFNSPPNLPAIRCRLLIRMCLLNSFSGNSSHVCLQKWLVSFNRKQEIL